MEEKYWRINFGALKFQKYNRNYGIIWNYQPYTWCPFDPYCINEKKNAGHNMAKVGEPCNVDAHAKIPALFRTRLCPRLCVHMHCTHWLWLYSSVVLLTDQSITSIQGTPDTTRTPHRVKCWARVPRLKITIHIIPKGIIWFLILYPYSIEFFVLNGILPCWP